MDLLVFIAGRQRGQRYPLEGDRLSIGRDRSSDIPLDDAGASRTHALILRGPGNALRLCDQGSTNGTRVDDRRVQEVKLEHGSRIAIGESVMLIERPPAEAPRVVMTETAHDPAKTLMLAMDSTVLLSPGTLVQEHAEAQQQIFDLFGYLNRISGLLDLDQLTRRALAEACRILKADRGAILLLQKEEDLAARTVWPEDGGEFAISRTVTEHVLREKKAILSNPGASDPNRLRDTLAISTRDVGSVLCVPLLADDRVLGLFYLQTALIHKPFGERHLHLLSAMATQLAIGIQNAALCRGLRNAEEFAAAILKSMSSGLLVVDARGVVVRANEAACSLLGADPRSLVGLPLSGHPVLGAFGPLVEETRSRGLPLERGDLRLSAGSREIPVDAHTSVLEDYAGRTIGALCMFRDLTRLRRLEEEVQRSQRLAALGSMAAGIAHEVRNPLNAVQGFAQLLLDGAEERRDEEHGQYARYILEEVGRIDRIVQEMLDFSRQRDPTMGVVRLDELLSSLASQLQPQAQAAGVRLAFASDAGAVQVIGSEDRLRQLFLNLARNALQACSRGGAVELRLGTGRHPSQVYPEAVVGVKDDGCGITPENLARIFDPFFTTKAVGTGLGLAICQKIAQEHSGRIEVESQAGLGSVFRVALPRRE